MSDNTVENTDSVDTRTPVEQAPRKREKSSSTEDTVSTPSTPTPRVAYEPSETIASVLEAISVVDHHDKKGIAQIVKAAIELRTEAKRTRDLAANAPE